MTHTENLIIGAGPGGLQLAHDFMQLGIDYLLIERSSKAGSFFERYPRHRQLISINKVYSDARSEEEKLRFDWNSLLCDNTKLLFRNYSKEFFPPADLLVNYLNDFASYYNLNIEFNSEVILIERENHGFQVSLKGNAKISCDRLYIATGRSELFKPDLDGITHCESYDEFSTDPRDFENQRVMIVGKGNSAFETADCLMNHTKSIHMCSPTPIRLAWKTHYVGHLRAINNGLLDTYQLKSGNTVLDAHIVSVRQNNDDTLTVHVKYVHAENQERKIKVDRVLLCSGFRFDRSIFSNDCLPTMRDDQKFPLVLGDWQSTNQRNMYFVGNLGHGLDYEKTFSGFIHGFRYNSRALAKLIACQKYQQDWGSDVFSFDADNLLSTILNRVNNSSALYQQPGFIGDLIAINSTEETFEWYEDVPISFVQTNGWMNKKHFWTLVLDYGKNEHPNPFNIQRFPHSKGGDDSTFLHPILRRYFNGKLMSSHHVSQDLENDWNGPRFEVPLGKFLAKDISKIRELSLESI